MQRLQAVTFDFWSTLAIPPTEQQDRRAEILVRELERAGAPRSRAAVDAAIKDALAAYRLAWTDNVQFCAPQAVDHILGGLDVDVAPAVRAELVEAMCIDPRAELTPNVETTLRTLKDAGLRLGIICDAGWTPSQILRAQLERHEVLELFDHWSFSDEVGAYKPSPAIFRHAHYGLGVSDPARAAHVGDLRRTDILGALRWGSIAVRYRGVFDDLSDGAEANYVIDDHAELPGVLDLASVSA